MTDNALQHPKLFHFISALDEDLAARARIKGCSFCGGVLHSARYPRIPRGGPLALEGVPTTRHSFCCESCRRRTTPASVRFLGRRIYPGFIVILVSAMQSGVTDPLVAELRGPWAWRAERYNAGAIGGARSSSIPHSGGKSGETSCQRSMTPPCLSVCWSVS